MKKNILITGVPRSGKSTLLRKLISNVPNKVGLVTNEMLIDRVRVGFETETHLGNKATLAHIDFITPNQVSKYFVNVENLENLIPEVLGFKKNDILYLDEIGQMQLFSEKFKELVLRYLNSENTCTATLSYMFENDFTKDIKERDDVILVKLSPENRNEKEIFVIALLKKIQKAKLYAQEPDKFIRKGKFIVLHSEHGIRTLTAQNGKWKCDCDFYKENQICSHVIATSELFTAS
jgi:nucleoside-triphosphatase THEP1